jgi:hypothetical protein
MGDGFDDGQTTAIELPFLRLVLNQARFILPDVDQKDGKASLFACFLIKKSSILVHSLRGLQQIAELLSSE